MKRRVLQTLSCTALLVAVFLLAAGTALAWDGSSASTSWSGSGTSGDPYVVSSAAELKGLANKVNTGTTYSGTYFKLGADVDLEDYAWVPIGGACSIDSTSGIPTGAHFDGVLDGRNHTISGINVSNPAAGTGAYGLFGYVGDGGVLANFNVAGSLNMGTSAINEIGAVVGYSQGSLYNLHSSVTVYMNDSSSTPSASMCGGIAGAVENLSSSKTTYVRYCSNTGSVTGRGRIGGIVGAVYCVSNGGVVVDQCYNTGDLTSTYSYTKIFTAGIVGYCRGYITSCYNQGNLATNNGHYLAGIVGMLQGADPVASLANCYSTAVFSNYAASHDRWLWASADYSSAVHITNCFWLPDAANSDITQPYDAAGSWGTQSYVSSITADELKGTAQMTESNDTGTFSGYVVDTYLGAADLDNANGSYGFGYASSGGYPVLGWQLITDFKVDPASGIPAPVTSYSIAATVVGGHGTVAVDPASVEAGGSSTVTLTPADGYWLESITDNGADVSGSVVGGTYTITNVSDNHTVVVAYTNGTHALTYTAGAHGSISGSSTQTVTDGADGTAVTAVAVSGYHFAAWTDGSSANPRTDTGVLADMTVGAIFLPDDAATTRPWDHFTIAVLPDTQNYSANYPAIFDQQTQWIADNAKSANIVFVAHLGDLVDTYNSVSQWQNARSSMSILRAAGIPYSVVPGNHDLNVVSHDVTYYDTYFPYTAFTSYSWYGGCYPTTSSASNYELFSAMGQKFIVLNLVCDQTMLTAATDWANAILTQYSDRKAIVVTHGYVDTSGAYLDSNSVAGLTAWNSVVKLHNNVIAVLSGHYSGEYEGTATGANDNTVYNLLTDYQDEPNGGNGWLRLYEFYPLENKVKAETYSPYLDQYQTDADSQFDVSLEQDSCAATGVTLNKSTSTLLVGGTDQLTATVAPANATNDAVTWSSDNTGVATVSSTGLVSATSLGSATITVTTEDGSKTASCAVTVTTADAAITTTDDATGEWSNDPVTVHFTASDSAEGMCIDHTMYSVDGGDWAQGDAATVTAPIDHAQDGIHTIQYYSVDNADNREATTHACTVKIDTTDPQVSGVVPAEGGKYVLGSSAALDWSASDALSGIEVEEATIGTSSVDKTTSLGSLSLGSYTLDLIVTDYAGNQTEVSNDFDIVDEASATPTTIDDAPDDWQNSDVTVDFTVDWVGSVGLAYTEYSTDGGATYVHGDSVTIEALASHGNDGAHIIWYRSVDNDGKSETAHSCTVSIDTTPPTVSNVLPADDATYMMGTYQVVDWTASDPGATASPVTGSGIDEVAATIDGEPVDIADALDDAGQGAHVFALIAADAAGNETTLSNAFTNVAETVTVSKPAAGAQWRVGNLQNVRFAVKYPLSSGQFGIMLVKGGDSTLLATLDATDGQSIYTYPWTVAGTAGDGYTIQVGWRSGTSGAWTVTGNSGAFTILKAQAITVTAPGADAAWPLKSTQTVSWTVEDPLSSGTFNVQLRDAAGRVKLTKTVNVKKGVTSYATKLRVSASVRVGTYTVKVSSDALSAVSPKFYVISERALRITTPSAHITWSRNASQTVSWTLYNKLTWGYFDICLKSAGGKSYTLVSSYALSSYPGTYSKSVTMPSNVPTGANYHLIVRWHDGASVLSAQSKAVTVKK